MNNNTVKIDDYVDITNFIKEDKTNKIKDNINNINCQEKILRYMIILKYSFLIIGTTVMFVSSSIENKNTSKILAIVGGCLNTLVLSGEKINDSIQKRIKSIKNELNNKIKSLKTTQYVA